MFINSIFGFSPVAWIRSQGAAMASENKPVLRSDLKPDIGNRGLTKIEFGGYPKSDPRL
jgi:hypothetical protein